MPSGPKLPFAWTGLEYGGLLIPIVCSEVIMSDEKRLQRIRLLQSVPVDPIEHFGRPLSDHLIGTHDLLYEWGNAEHVCLAGLFHSIYGTKTFTRATVTTRERNRIRRLIGTDAEMLVYIFCMSDRRRLLLDNQVPPYCWTDHRTGKASPITNDVLNQLVEIEVANFVEQIPVLTASPARVLEDMRYRFAVARSRMSPLAARAFARALDDKAAGLETHAQHER